ncbi:hypothetical protein [Brevundimonas diminuta]|uniref:hypothetical protein n=1 Tax=Brevundimonas diminuta TaxID=293 RepID=UPI003D9A7E7B
MMDPLLFEALKADAKIVHLVTVDLPGHVIRWSDGGFVRWDGETYRARDERYGVLESIGEITDGVGDDASPVEIGVIPPTLASLEDLIAVDAQGGVVSIHLGAVDEATGLLIGAPYRLHRGRLDRPIVGIGAMTLTYEVLTAEALGLEANEDQRLSDAFHQSVWPGERGYEHQTSGTKKVWWRDDDPNNAIGYISPRRKKGGDPKEFNYETDAALPFPFGRVQVGAALNYRVGFGPTNRYNSIVGTVAASGPIKSWPIVLVDDVPTSFGANDVATNGEHAGALWMQRKLGAQPQAALTFPSGLNTGGQAPQGWGADYGQSGRAVFLATMFENSKKSEYQGGVPTFKNTLEGLFGWDPRHGDSQLLEPATWRYIEHGPIADLNWCIGRWEGASGGGLYGVPYACSIVGGLGAAIEDIDIDAFVYAAEVAAANGWKVSYVATSAMDKQDVRKALLQSAGAVPSRKGGLISCISHGAPRPSRMDVTNADTAGGFDVEFWASRLDRRNTLIPRFTSEEHLWELTPIEPVTNTVWRSQDGGKRSDGRSYDAVPDENQCAQLAYLDLANDRELTSETPFKPHMLAVEPGDNFTWREPRFLLDGVKAQARVRKYDPSKRLVRIHWRQETDSKYVEAKVQTGVAPPPSVPSVTPGPFVPPAPVIVSATPVPYSTGARIRLIIENPFQPEWSYVVRWKVRDGAFLSWVSETPVPIIMSGATLELNTSVVPRDALIDVEVAFAVTQPGTFSSTVVQTPADTEAARSPAGRDAITITADKDTITIGAFDAYMGDGQTISIPAGTITGLASSTRWGVFWRADLGFQAEEHPAAVRMTTGQWIFLGWVSTSDAGGSYPTPPPPPPGWGGSNGNEMAVLT